MCQFADTLKNELSFCTNTITAEMTGPLFFSVGEPSGDLHAANLIRSLREKQPSLAMRGFGGLRMTKAGLECDFDLTTLAVVGFAEVIPKLKEFYRVADMAEDIFRRDGCCGVVLVDFPGFNWHIAKRAKKYGLPVFYYLPPQLWAWGGWRIRKMRRYVDHVLCNLPFEKTWFEQRGVSAEYVGHPFFDEVQSHRLCARFLNQWEDKERLQVAVLPGSRDREVLNIWPLQLEMIRRLHKQSPSTRFLVAALKDQHALYCRSLLSSHDRHLPLEVFVGKTSEIIELADCGLIKSGSVSLEMMARQTPCAVIYHVSSSTYAIGRMLVRTKYMSLPNLIAGDSIMPEFLAVGKSTKVIDAATQTMLRLLTDPKFREAQKKSLRSLSVQFAQPGASEKAAKAILRELSPAMAEAQQALDTRAA